MIKRRPIKVAHIVPAPWHRPVDVQLKVYPLERLPSVVLCAEANRSGQVMNDARGRSHGALEKRDPLRSASRADRNPYPISFGSRSALGNLTSGAGARGANGPISPAAGMRVTGPSAASSNPRKRPAL